MGYSFVVLKETCVLQKSQRAISYKEYIVKAVRIRSFRSYRDSLTSRTLESIHEANCRYSKHEFGHRSINFALLEDRGGGYFQAASRNCLLPENRKLLTTTGLGNLFPAQFAFPSQLPFFQLSPCQILGTKVQKPCGLDCGKWLLCHTPWATV